MNVTKCKQTDQQSDIYLVCGVDTKLDLTVPPKSHAVGNIPFNWGDKNGRKGLFINDAIAGGGGGDKPKDDE